MKITINTDVFKLGGTVTNLSPSAELQLYLIGAEFYKLFKELSLPDVAVEVISITPIATEGHYSNKEKLFKKEEFNLLVKIVLVLSGFRNKLVNKMEIVAEYSSIKEQIIFYYNRKSDVNYLEKFSTPTRFATLLIYGISDVIKSLSKEVYGEASALNTLAEKMLIKS